MSQLGGTKRQLGPVPQAIPIRVGDAVCSSSPRGKLLDLAAASGSFWNMLLSVLLLATLTRGIVWVRGNQRRLARIVDYLNFLPGEAERHFGVAMF